MGEHAIILKQAEKHADDFKLGPVDLHIPSGYITAIVGPNGSGKSTLFRLLMNLLQLDGGTLTVLDRQYPEDDIALKERIGYMPDVYDVIEESMTGTQVIDFIKPFYANWNEREYERLVTRFNVNLHKKFRKMSKGMVQKFSLVQTLSSSPELLLLDEPSAGLDPLAWSDMMEEIHRFMEQPGHTAVIATHNIEEVRRLADYVAFMYEGRVLGFYEKDRLLTDWKEIWLDRELTVSQSAALPGIVRVDPAQPQRIITEDYAETIAALRETGVDVYQTQSVQLDEIMRYLIEQASD